MPKSAGEFVTKLSQDPALIEEFKRDPDALMDAHGLSDDDKAVLKSGDVDKIKAHLGEDGPPGCMVLGF
jgi:hypothetical protein